MILESVQFPLGLTVKIFCSPCKVASILDQLELVVPPVGSVSVPNLLVLLPPMLGGSPLDPAWQLQRQHPLASASAPVWQLRQPQVVSVLVQVKKYIKLYYLTDGMSSWQFYRQSRHPFSDASVPHEGQPLCPVPPRRCSDCLHQKDIPPKLCSTSVRSLH